MDKGGDGVMTKRYRGDMKWAWMEQDGSVP